LNFHSVMVLTGVFSITNGRSDDTSDPPPTPRGHQCQDRPHNNNNEGI